MLVNRVKPHTDFAGPMGSGLMKMLCIGLGNQEGADRLHRAGVARDLGEIVHEAGVAILARLRSCSAWPYWKTSGTSPASWF